MFPSASLSANDLLLSATKTTEKVDIKKEKRQAIANIRLSNTYQEGGFKNFRLESNFTYHPALEIGLYTGFNHPQRGGAKGNEMPLKRNEANNTYAIPVAMQVNFFPFALWLKDNYRKDLKFDLWIGLKSGLLVESELFAAGDYHYFEGGTPTMELTRVEYSRSADERHITVLPECSLSLGMGRTFRNGFGFFFEGSVGSHRMSLFPGFDLRWGLSYHFWK